MKKVIVIFGYGPGISNAVAQKFGSEGFSVALVARNRERLEAGVASLKARGVEAASFVADASDPAAIAQALDGARQALGPITVVQWTAYGMGAGDVLSVSADELRGVFDVSIVGLTAAVKSALGDLKNSADAAVLVTNGGLGYFDPAVDKLGVDWNVMGLSIANSAKHKLVRLLSHKLKPEGIYVGEVVVVSTVKGTAFDANGQGTLEPSRVADEFWSLYSTRDRVSVTVS